MVIVALGLMTTAVCSFLVFLGIQKCRFWLRRRRAEKRIAVWQEREAATAHVSKSREIELAR